MSKNRLSRWWKSLSPEAKLVMCQAAVYILQRFVDLGDVYARHVLL
jgi:hypothetical protein